MPTFTEYQDVSVDIDVSVEDFYNEMDSFEKDEMVKLLIKDKYDTINFSVGHGFDAYNFEQSISKLIKNYHRLTMVEIESIIGISNRF